jgi:Protein of unknown function (DUF1007)
MVCVVLVQPAVAHPHIFAKYEIDIAQKDDAAYALHFTFRVRNVVTPNPLIRDQQYKTDNLLDAMAQHPIYIFLDVDGHPLGQQNVELTRTGETDHEPIYTFDMEIPAGAGDFGFSIYDPEYYDAVSLAAADALRVEIAKLSCWASHEEAGEKPCGASTARRTWNVATVIIHYRAPVHQRSFRLEDRCLESKTCRPKCAESPTKASHSALELSSRCRDYLHNMKPSLLQFL